MNLLEKSAIAQKHYESVRSKTLVHGGEEFVATDGINCLIVGRDYIPETADIIVFKLDTRNMLTKCELFRQIAE